MLPDLDEYILGHRPGPNPTLSLNRGDVIEIQGPAASGKTQLLYHLAACCVLPKEVLIAEANVHAESTVHVGGWGKSVIVFDCDGRWNVKRLHDILQTRLRIAFSRVHLPPRPDKYTAEISSVAMGSLNRLHVFKPTSSFQLVATLQYLPKYHAEDMPNEDIRLVFVDSISSFYWADRWQAETSVPKKPQRSDSVGATLRALQNFRISHGPVTILTNWGLNPLITGSSPAQFFKQHITASYYSAPPDDPPREGSLPLTYHITLPFSFAAQLQFNMTSSECGELEQALQDPGRKEAVNLGEIRGYVRIPRTDRSSLDVAPQNEIGRFSFRLLEHDIIVAPESTNISARR